MGGALPARNALPAAPQAGNQPSYTALQGGCTGQRGTMFAIPYPYIDPVLVEIGPFAIRWYALAYLFGLMLGWQYTRWLAKHSLGRVAPIDVDDFLIWATAGVILGGRLGYVLFYRPEFYLANPLEIAKVWQGGMSFHGGLLGVIVAGVLFCRSRKLAIRPFADLIFCAAPIGLFLGRLANFINAELVGRPADVPWAMVFPGHAEPRHPSQLYQAALEGLVLFGLLHILWRVEAIRSRAGVLSGAFLIGYGVFRSFAELFRQPDANLGLLYAGTTMGQLLSLPMIAAGIALIWFARKGR
jgi:phosphatidylglycerol---prolipoprotein diacylglyceryl transferase